MLIRVIRTGNKYDYVKDYMLDNLIGSQAIVKFKRSTGWATIGLDPIREGNRYALINGTNKRTIGNSVSVSRYRRDN
ncbi:MAG: GSU3473 family protein [Smithellaceae bacterium]|jgi:hypothetical protein